MIDNTIKLSPFANDILKGLNSIPKKLPSHYFYDAVGDKIFQEIMSLKEYYLTRSELEIFHVHKNNILEALQPPFRIIELGAGDGLKTKVLLKHFANTVVNFTYSPVDISEDILIELQKKLADEIPQLNVEPLCGNYFQIMNQVFKKNKQKNVIFFLGSNIGNYTKELRSDFLSKLRENMKKGDLLFIGFDLKKDPNVILNAYNDPKGITAKFNKNLLTRINCELKANFNIKHFKHFPQYNPHSGECFSFLMSTKQQSVYSETLSSHFYFEEWESIYMEVSKKFSENEIENLLANHGFSIRESFTDSKNFFLNSICEAV